MTDSYTDIHKNMRHWLHELARFRGRPVYYDVGANRGMFVHHMAALVDSIIAFEPVEATFHTLRDEAPENTIAIQAGLGERRDELVIHHFSDDTFNSLYDRATGDLSHYGLTKTGTETVSILSLDSLLAGEKAALDIVGLAEAPPEPQVMKIDIEGAELSALKGMEQLLRRNPPLILCEYSVDNTQNAGYSRKEIANFLTACGYSLYGLYRNEDLNLHSDIEARSIWNIVAVPKKQHPGFVETFHEYLLDSE